jgi:uncharacterized integral membrane protein
MRYLVWALRAFIFFTLFAFALNNEHKVQLNWFFGYHWQAPLVIVVLAVLAAGAALGVLAMLPSWWRHRSLAMRQTTETSAQTTPVPDSAPVTPSELGPEHPPRVGL